MFDVVQNTVSYDRFIGLFNVKHTDTNNENYLYFFDHHLYAIIIYLIQLLLLYMQV